jgi:hypothetical protein
VTRGAVLRWTADRLPGVDPEWRSELRRTVEVVATDAGRRERLLELVGLLGFALATMSRRGGGDDRAELVRQGLRVGALLLAVVAALDAGATPVGASLTTSAVPLAALAAAVALGGGLGRVAVAAVAASTVLHVVAGRGVVVPVLVLVLAVLGRRFDARSCPLGAGLTAAGVAAGWLAVDALGSAVPLVVTAGALGASLVLMLLGWFDPRFAVAATALWFWRLIAVDVAELGHAVTSLADGPAARQALLARWFVMAAGVVVGWQISERALHRCLHARR